MADNIKGVANEIKGVLDGLLSDEETPNVQTNNRINVRENERTNRRAVVEKVRRANGTDTDKEKPKKTQGSVMFELETIDKIEDIKKWARKNGTRKDKGMIIKEAIDLLHEKLKNDI